MASPIPINQELDIGHLQAGHPGERVDRHDRRVDGVTTCEVERVRAGVVTAMPSMTQISSSSMLSAHAVTPGVGLRLVSMIAAGKHASIQRAPWSDDAENPARTPRRLDLSQAPLARTMGVTREFLSWYTSWWSATKSRLSA